MIDTGSAHLPKGQSASRPYAGILSECRDLVRNRTCRVLSHLRDALIEDIETRIQATADPDLVLPLRELQKNLQNDVGMLEQCFGTAFDHAFGELSRKKPQESSSLYSDGEISGMELSLVDDEAFSETLTVKGQANILHHACDYELKDLVPRIALMLGASDLDASDNPAGPEAVSEALKEACWSYECPREAKELLFELLTRKLAPELRTIYHEVNNHLVMRRVLPQVRPPVRRGGKGRKLPGGRSEGTTTETSDVLKQLFALGDGGGEMPGAIPSSPFRGQSAAAGVIQMLGKLQQGESGVTLGDQPFSVDMDAAATMNVLHGLLDAGIGKHVGKVDNIVIDVVATLFDFIFDDERVPETMKGLIGRLQLPVLKLALSDHSFFSNRLHPSRKLINAMAQAASTWDGELTPDSTLYQAAEPLVLRIQTEACDDAGVFASCLASFEHFLSEQERLADEKAAALTGKLEEREQLEIARTVAEGAVAAHCADATVPEAVRRFLLDCWVDVLSRTARSDGEDGTQWNAAVATMDDLVWSIQPKKGAEERQRLVTLLPRLLGGLRSGLDTTKIDAAIREAFFAELVKLHAAAVRAGMTSSDSASGPVATTAADDAVAQDAQPDESDSPDTIGLEDLTRGTWIELHLESGERRAVRLTWISPARTMYLFANRQGARALALTQRELLRKLLGGDAVVLNEEPLMDRIVADVLDEYQPGAQGVEP